MSTARSPGQAIAVELKQMPKAGNHHTPQRALNHLTPSRHAINGTPKSPVSSFFIEKVCLQVGLDI